MRGWHTAEAKRRASLVIGDRVTEEAEQAIANVRAQVETARRTLLARVMGTDSAEDQLQYGDGQPHEVDDE